MTSTTDNAPVDPTVDNPSADVLTVTDAEDSGNDAVTYQGTDDRGREVFEANPDYVDPAEQTNDEERVKLHVLTPFIDSITLTSHEVDYTITRAGTDVPVSAVQDIIEQAAVQSVAVSTKG